MTFCLKNTCLDIAGDLSTHSCIHHYCIRADLLMSIPVNHAVIHVSSSDCMHHHYYAIYEVNMPVFMIFPEVDDFMQWRVGNNWYSQ